MEITVHNRCWNDSSHTPGLWDSPEPDVESKGGTRVMFSGWAGPVERQRGGPQGAELSCLPRPWFLGQRGWRPQPVSGASPSAVDDIGHSHPHGLLFEPLTQRASIQKGELAIFASKKKKEKSQAKHLLNSFLTLKLLLFALNPLFFPCSLCSLLSC